mmetsp:Transcript_56502/g.115646  ORF Transcript_56502/g.115646 Transcript_56502/m.115646 type:complete len:236 (-) Transcript_56502:348-1055(-)
MCGSSHIAAASTTLTFCPPDSPRILLCDANSASRPIAPSAFSTSLAVRALPEVPRRSASRSSMRFTILVKPISRSLSRESHELFSRLLCNHFTSYSYPLLYFLLEMMSSKTRLSVVPSARVISLASSIFSRSSLLICLASLFRLSLSSPPAYRHWMYSFGVESRCFSKWWNACWATYAMRMLGCFQTVPDCGLNSPVSSLMIVDLPAPFGPMTATREEREAWSDTPVTVGASLPG